MSLSDFQNSFTVTDKMMNELIHLGENAGIAYDEEDYIASKPLIINRIKSFIARSVWNNEGWYRIANEYNEVYKEALKQFDQAEHLASAETLMVQ